MIPFALPALPAWATKELLGKVLRFAVIAFLAFRLLGILSDWQKDAQANRAAQVQAAADKATAEANVRTQETANAILRDTIAVQKQALADAAAARQALESAFAQYRADEARRNQRVTNPKFAAGVQANPAKAAAEANAAQSDLKKQYEETFR